ncbi:GNAT family N-acetyltransferase [Silvibacterium dinghuense]|nr:GNAT family N-acetyltransferase [Silvibacterium dinghuense]GGG97168.1 hypothetical protein GCM10011586_10530 [Silvibacterium dinghuense]
MSIVLRMAEDADFPVMAELRAAAWGEREFWMERLIRYRLGQHSPQHALLERAIFVADDAGSVVGFVAGHRTRRFDCDGELQWINVVAHRRGEDVAVRLMSRMGVWFVEQQLSRVCVNVDPANRVARRLYARCGAQALHEQWMVWEDARTMAESVSADGL